MSVDVQDWALSADNGYLVPPIFIRELSDDERRSLTAGLRSRESFVVRRCQILIRSSEGQRPARIASALGIASQTVRNVLHAFEERGLGCLERESNAPKSQRPVLDLDIVETRERFERLVRQSPRAFGKERSTWSLTVLADVCSEQGLTPVRLSDETIRRAVHRLGLRFERAKDWIQSPDPAYGRKKGAATG